MMRPILIIEDNYEKLAEISQVVTALTSSEIIHAATISAAYRTLEGTKCDLIILDMTFQISHRTDRSIAKESLAGIEILQYMAHRRISTPVIVATQHTHFLHPDIPGIDSIQKLDELLRSLFPRIYRGIIQVDLSETEWKKLLFSIITGAIKKNE